MKNLDYAIRKTIIDLDIPEDRIEDTKIIVTRYWKEIYEKTVTDKMEDDKSTLFLRNIGIFTISRYKLNKFILKVIGKIRNMRKSVKYTSEVKEKQINKLTEKLKKALIHRNVISIYYAKHFKNI